MSLESRLESLRAKPMHIRGRYAFWTAFGVTAVIFTFWTASFTSLGSSAQGSVISTLKKADAPASSLVASVGSIFNDVKNMIFTSKKVTFSNIEVIPGHK